MNETGDPVSIKVNKLQELPFMEFTLTIGSFILNFSESSQTLAITFDSSLEISVAATAVDGLAVNVDMQTVPFVSI